MDHLEILRSDGLSRCRVADFCLDCIVNDLTAAGVQPVIVVQSVLLKDHVPHQ